MKTLTQILRILLAISTSVFTFAFLDSCSSNKVNAGGSSVYANPDSIQYTAENYAYMLNYTYKNFEQPVPRSALDSIQNAADDEAAKIAYEKAIDAFVDSGVSKARWEKYFRSATGVGDDNDEESRYPEHLFGYVMLSGKPINELILAQYAIDDNGNKVTSNYSPVADTADQAGYFTIQAFLEVHLNSFKFKMVREVVDFNLCDTAPYSRVQLFTWTSTQINTKYTSSGGIQCISCHQNMNPIRGAFHNFDGNGNQNYQANRSRNSDQYREEPGAGDGSTLEPRNSDGSVMDETTSESSMYKLTSGGAALSTPRDLALEISKNARYPRCMVERMFSVIFNTPEGHNGINYVVPDNYAENEAQVKYLDDWTDKFNEANQIPKDFLKTILKDKSYLVISYHPGE